MEWLTDLIARRAHLTPDKVALRELATGRQATYRALNDRAALSAGLLARLGVGAGDRVGVLCRNRIAFFDLLFACAKIGAVLVPLNWRMPAAELAPVVAQAELRVLFFGEEDGPTASLLASAAYKSIDLERDYDQMLAASTPIAGRDMWPSAETWSLLFTSGTTGKPRAVIQTYGMALVNAVNIGQAIDIVGDDVTLNFLPLFHTAGINLWTLPTLLCGGSVLITPGFDASTTIDLLASGALTTFFGVPTVYQQLAAHPRFGEVDLASVRRWACGGAPLSDVLVHAFAARGAIVCNGFGMTETGPTVFLQSSDLATRKIGTVGKPQILAQAKIVHPDGSSAAVGEQGELLIRGPGVTPGYWRDEEATRAAFTADGWLKTGDLATCDEDGWYRIVGRAKDMFISGGENVYPAEVEAVLAQHPAVLEAAVLGVADDKWGEVGKAFILLRERAPGPSAEELAAFCRARLAPYKVPAHWQFVDEFPRTGSGKVQKHLLSAAGRPA